MQASVGLSIVRSWKKLFGLNKSMDSNLLAILLTVNITPKMTSILSDQISLQQVNTHQYTASWHHDWTAGPAIHGGCIAAIIHHTAIQHLATTLAKLQQPDILSLHLDFLSPCTTENFHITVVELKEGKIVTTFRLDLSQANRTCVTAIATSINFDVPLGPTGDTEWTLYPPLKSIPNFEKVSRNQVEDNWIPGTMGGQVYPFTNRMLLLYPREGIPDSGTPLDICSSFSGTEKISGAYLSLLADCIPSMSDTILRNNGMYDARRFFNTLKEGSEKHPGVPTKSYTLLKDAAENATTWNNTVSLDIDFKKRLPKDGLDWIFMRLSTQSLQNGRMDLDMTMLDEKMNIVCLARQIVLVLDAKKKFNKAKNLSNKSKL